jgi:hypothetical protein
MNLCHRLAQLERLARLRGDLGEPQEPMTLEDTAARIQELLIWTQGTMKVPQFKVAWETAMRVCEADLDPDDPVRKSAVSSSMTALEAALAEWEEYSRTGRYRCNAMEAIQVSLWNGVPPPLPRCERCGIFHGSTPEGNEPSDLTPRPAVPARPPAPAEGSTRQARR